MVSRVVADDVDDGSKGAFGVVQVGQAVGESRAQVQQGGGGFVGHSAIAVSGAGDDPFKQPQYGPHAGNLVDCRNQLHLGGAGIGKANLDAGIDQ